MFSPPVRNVKKGSAHFAPISISSLLSPGVTVISVAVRPNGAPIIHLSSGSALTYDPMLCTFTQLADKWFIGGSEAWQGRQRSSNSTRGVVGSIEQFIAEGVPAGEGADTPRPEWWAAALTLGHLDGKLHAARLLDSPAEYKQALLVYAQRLANEGFRGKAEELIKELFGPVYWYAHISDVHSNSYPILKASRKWRVMDSHCGRTIETRPSERSPHCVRCACSSLLAFFLLSVSSVRSKTLAKLAQDWQDIARRTALGE